MSGSLHEPVRLVVGEARHWRLGALDLFVRRVASGWLVQALVGHSARAMERDDVLAAPIEWQPENAAAEVVQYYTGGSASDEIMLRPLLPDRPVVARPREPFAIAPGQEATLFVSVALWFELVTGDGVCLAAHPSVRLADTWFGPSTRSGALCYASLTRCRTALEDVIVRSWRAVTPVVLHNRGQDVWSLDRVALPVTLLPVFRSADGRYWTSELSALRDVTGEVEAVRAGTDAPRDVRGERVAAPRNDDRTSWLGRFYGKLF